MKDTPVRTCEIKFQNPLSGVRPSHPITAIWQELLQGKIPFPWRYGHASHPTSTVKRDLKAYSTSFLKMPIQDPYTTHCEGGVKVAT